MKYQNGLLRVVVGPMFSGKTGYLINKCKSFETTSVAVPIAFKPTRDTRYGVGQLMSHDEQSYPAFEVDNAVEIIKKASDIRYRRIIIDEAHMIEDATGLVEVCKLLALEGREVFVGALKTDFNGNPFKSTMLLMAHADDIVSITTLCQEEDCSAIGTYHELQRDSHPKDGNNIVVGGDNLYKVKCRVHFNPNR